MTAIERLPTEGTFFKFTDSSPLGQSIYDAYTDQTFRDEARDLLINDALISMRAAVENLTTNGDSKSVVDSINIRYMEDHYTSEEVAAPYQKTLTILDWLKRASDADLVEFSLWHTDRYAQAEANLKRLWPEVVASVESQSEKLISIGLHPPESRRAFEAAFHGTRSPTFIDSFAAGARGVDAYYRYLDGRMFVTNLFDDKLSFETVGPSMKATGFHEYMHASGHWYGSSYWPDRLTEEAVVSHSTAVATKREPDLNTFDPDKRSGDAGQYKFIRQILSLAMENGPVKISPRDLTDGYYDISKNHTARRYVWESLGTNMAAILPDYTGNDFRDFGRLYNKAYERGVSRQFAARLLTKMRNHLALDADSDGEQLPRQEIKHIAASES